MPIRYMTMKDVPRVCALEQMLFASPWSAADLIYEMKLNPFGRFFVYEVNGLIVGYIGMWFAYEDATVTNLGVDPQHQRQGIAKALLDYAIRASADEGCKRCTLEVRVSNAPAISLYEGFGFKQAAIRKNYYTDTNEDAYLMVLERDDLYGHNTGN